EHRVAVHTRQCKVKRNDTWPEFSRRHYRVFAMLRNQDLKSFFPSDIYKNSRKAVVILDDQCHPIPGLKVISIVRDCNMDPRRQFICRLTCQRNKALRRLSIAVELLLGDSACRPADTMQLLVIRFGQIKSKRAAFTWPAFECDLASKQPSYFAADRKPQARTA